MLKKNNNSPTITTQLTKRNLNQTKQIQSNPITTKPNMRKMDKGLTRLLPIGLWLSFWCWYWCATNAPHTSIVRAQYTEQTRMLEYYKRGYKFPFESYNPETDGWRKLMDQRFDQVRALTDSQMKWDGWIQTANSAVTAPNFTEFGWGLTQAPDLLTMDIRQAIYEGIPRAREEGDIQVIAGPEQPLFIDRPELNERALKELQPILEAWSGIELVPAIAYGFRLYRCVDSLIN